MVAKVMFPIKITPAMVTASVVPDADAAMGETAWNPATNYTVIGTEVVRATTGKKYKALATGVDTGLPENTPLRWKDTFRPTNKMAAYDSYRSTKIRYAGTLTQTIRPGIITDLAFYGLEGDALHVVIRNVTSGVAYFDQNYSLATYTTGDLEWEFWFGTPTQQENLRIMGLYPNDAQVEITLTASVETGYAGIGILAMGSFSDIGDPQFDFKAKLVDYSYIDIDETGEAVIEKGPNTKDLAGSCLCDSANANAVMDVFTRALGVPCAYVISDLAQYDYLSAFGLGTCEIKPHDNDAETLVSTTVRGLI